LAWRRYVRLAKPYLAALVVTILVAALARQILFDADTPTAPSPLQVAAHVLLIHDLVKVDALSAGVWYVAIDFQLYGLLLLILWTSQRVAGNSRIDLRRLTLAAVIGLSALSLLWFNRDPSMDPWAFYFFGAYGLGVMVQWSSGFTRKYPWLGILGAVVIVALALEWRSRLVVAAVTALTLGIGLHLKPALGSAVRSTMAWLGRTSYCLFLIHYPIVLIVGTLVARLWPGNVAVHVAGLVAAWALSIVAAGGLYRSVEANPRKSLRPMTS
jgi:peptidoglycan/LPS O-acetylase OafA/YrhL